MQCEKCDNRAILGDPLLCKDHFICYFEETIKTTIAEYDLIQQDSRVCVAASGGKDSLVTLYVLKKLGHDVHALAIDEGIGGYREHTLLDLQKFCTKYDIPLKIASFKELTGNTLDEILKRKKLHACTVCGTFRRYLLNKHAAGFDVLATGHNADDEAQAVLMNLLRAQTSILARPGPKTGSEKEGFIQRVKPLYFLTEKEIMTYAIIHNILLDFTECPNVTTSYRARVRDLLNEYAAKHPGTKKRVLEKFLRIRAALPTSNNQIDSCRKCGEPATGDVCAACRMLVTIRT